MHDTHALDIRPSVNGSMSMCECVMCVLGIVCPIRPAQFTYTPFAVYACVHDENEYYAELLVLCSIHLARTLGRAARSARTPNTRGL